MAAREKTICAHTDLSGERKKNESRGAARIVVESPYPKDPKSSHVRVRPTNGNETELPP